LPAWEKPQEVATYLRENGFSEVPLLWCKLDSNAKKRRVPDPDGVIIAGSGEDLGLGEEREAQVSRRIAFANKYGSKKTGLRQDKTHAGNSLIEAAIKMGIARNWFLSGSTNIRTDESEQESIEVSESPDFILHYDRLNEAASYAEQLSHWFGKQTKQEAKPSSDSDTVLELIVSEACVAVVHFKKGELRDDCAYKLEAKGELSLDKNKDLVRYFPFLLPMLRQRMERQSEVFRNQKYEIQINGEERTVILHALGVLVGQTGAFPASCAADYVSRYKENQNHIGTVKQLHQKFLALMGKEKASPFKNKKKIGSGRRKSVLGKKVSSNE
jgi:hypothetical protein